MTSRMQILATIGADLVLAFTFLISVQIAAGWGELCGIRPGGDKSGLGGFAMLLLFFLMRWIVLGVCLLATASDERWWLLVAHGAVGWVSTTVFQRSVDRVHADRTVPDVIGIAGSTLIPAPAWILSLQRVNSVWLDDSAIALAGIATVVLLLHYTCYRRRRTSMLASRA